MGPLSWLSHAPLARPPAADAVHRRVARRGRGHRDHGRGQVLRPTGHSAGRIPPRRSSDRPAPIAAHDATSPQPTPPRPAVKSAEPHEASRAVNARLQPRLRQRTLHLWRRHDARRRHLPPAPEPEAETTTVSSAPARASKPARAGIRRPPRAAPHTSCHIAALPRRSARLFHRPRLRPPRTWRRASALAGTRPCSRTPALTRSPAGRPRSHQDPRASPPRTSLHRHRRHPVPLHRPAGHQSQWTRSRSPPPRTPTASRPSPSPPTITAARPTAATNTSAPDSFTITVLPVNDAPTFNAGANQTVLEDTGAQSIAGWVTRSHRDPRTSSTQTVSFTASADIPALFAIQPAIAPDGTLTYTPAANANGVATVTVTARRQRRHRQRWQQHQRPQTFTITITAVNDAPSFTAGAQPDRTARTTAPRSSLRLQRPRSRLDPRTSHRRPSASRHERQPATLQRRNPRSRPTGHSRTPPPRTPTASPRSPSPLSTTAALPTAARTPASPAPSPSPSTPSTTPPPSARDQISRLSRSSARRPSQAGRRASRQGRRTSPPRTSPSPSRAPTEGSSQSNPQSRPTECSRSRRPCSRSEPRPSPCARRRRRQLRGGSDTSAPQTFTITIL